MQFIFYSFILVIPFLFGLTQVKICVNCKFYISGDRCGLFPKIEKLENVQVDSEYKRNFLEFLVSGKNVPKLISPESYYFCSTAREFKDMCGTEGSKYKSIKS